MNTFRTELRNLFVSPQAWAIASAYLIISGVFFVVLLIGRQIADLEAYYSNIETTLIVVAPIVAMRSFAEERRSGALDISLSWPVRRWSLVLGKYAANTAFVWLLVCIVWLYVWLLDRRVDVEVGKAAAGFVGLLLLTAAFNALSLGVSARSASPTTAAFVGFGLLLGLWILDFIPGWIGGSLESFVEWLAPTNHIAESGRGVLDFGDVLYFVSLTAVGLTFAAWSLKEPGARSLRGFARERYVGAGIGLVVILVLGVWSTSASGQFDLTPNTRFTLTGNSQAVLRQADGPITVYGFVEPGGPQFAQMKSLIRQYQVLKDDISLEFLDPDAQPARAKELGATTYGQMVVEVNGRRELVRDIFEIDVTSAIQRLSRIEPPLACFTVGHGERDITDVLSGGFLSFAARLEEIGFDNTPLALGAEGGPERLAECSVVIVGGPRVPFLDSEIELLEDFAQAEGRLVVFFDTESTEVTDQLNDLIESWGLTVRPGTVTDRSSLIDDPGSIVAYRYPSASPVTQELARNNIPVMMVGSQAVEPALAGLGEQGWLTPLVETSSRSDHPDPDALGPYTLAAITDWSRVTADENADPTIARTRIGVVGTVEVAANDFIGRFGNTIFSTQLVSWVSREDNIISASRDPAAIVRIALTEDDRNDLIRDAIVLPTLVTLLFFGLAFVRLRRG